MNIRELRGEDLEAVREALVACGNFNAEEIRVAAEMAASLDDYTLFVAEIAGKVRGFYCIGKTPLTLATWYLYWICVHPDSQGMGVGRQLQAHAEEFIREGGGERVVLETSGRLDYERTRRFYADAGYELVGRITDFYKPGDDCLILCKRLTP